MASRDIDRTRLITRRALFLGGLQGVVLMTLGGRLAWLQIRKHDEYRTKSAENQFDDRLLVPSRGIITDRNGKPLASNRQSFRSTLVPEQTPDVVETLTRLIDLLGWNHDDFAAVQAVLVKKSARRTEKFQPVTLAENLDWNQVAKIEYHAPVLPGVAIEVGELRHYPYGEAAAHLVGYVGAVSEKDMTDDPLLRQPGIRIGKEGVELQHEKDLRGEAGIVKMEVNAIGRPIREAERRPARSGDDITLTLDADLQQFAFERLSQEESASAVVMDVHSGAIYAMATTPAYDPNIFASGIPRKIWQDLIADERSPLLNKCVSGQYPPGSTFKMMTALAALESGAIGLGTRVYCPGHLDLGSHRFHCWKKGGHGSVDVETALAGSCDVFFYEVGRRTGIDNIARMARRFGLGSKLNLDLPREKPGLVPDAAWKQAKYAVPWQIGETFVCSIGQGYMKSTPLQLATMTARLASGGLGVQPHLTRAIGNRNIEPVKFDQLGINHAHLDAVMRGMVAVCAPGGTAHAAQIKTPGMEMAGKTGTSQVRRISMAERAAGLKIETLPWKQRHHALFVGYAPLDNPRYACCVVVEHGMSGSAAAAPIASALLEKVQQLNMTAGTGIAR